MILKGMVVTLHVESVQRKLKVMKLNWLHPSARKAKISKKLNKKYNDVFGKNIPSIQGWNEVFMRLTSEEIIYISKYKWRGSLDQNALFQEALSTALFELTFGLRLE
jgi:hypothetical protein